MNNKRILAVICSTVFSGLAFSAETIDQAKELDPINVIASENQLKTSDPTKIKTHIHVSDKTKSPQNLTDLISASPSVSQNGQGGHFQNFSIRGVAKHRIKTLINGIRINGVRRAGASVSFIDPLLIGDAIVERNPASTKYGSGALGGAVQFEANHFITPTAITGYNIVGNENYQIFGNGQKNWSFGIARRDANNSTAKNGAELNTHFTQYSATFAAKGKVNGLELDFFALPSFAKDVGKSNTDFPKRKTNYPEEKHLLAKLTISSESGWKADLYIHPNDLDTNVLKVDSSFNKVSSKAFDFGGSWQLEKQIDNTNTLLGMDYSGRNAVSINESALDLNTGILTRSVPLQNGREKEISLFTTFNWMWDWAEIEAGSRLSYFDQSAKNVVSRNDHAWSGFLNLIYPFENGFQITYSLSTGYRYPTLSERFFTGTTGRGNVISNPDLNKERSFNVDLGVGWSSENISLASHIYYLGIKDYIERVEISDDVLTFINLNNGKISGLEIEGNYIINDRWSINWAGHLIHGEDENGNSLSDIPANRILAGLKYNSDKWESLINLEYRSHKNDYGNGEKKIPSTKLLSAVAHYQASPKIQLSISGNNLLNEEYFASADRKSNFAQERSIGFSIKWQFD